MFSQFSRKRRISSRISYAIGSITSMILFGFLLAFAFTPSEEIPQDGGTLGGALKAIMGNNWETASSVSNASQLGGIGANYYIQGGAIDKLCTNTLAATTLGAKSGSGLFQKINPNGSFVCADQIKSGSGILRPILATIRDLDASCYGQVTIQNASGSTYSPSNSDPVDIYEGDTITTAQSCSLASLYFIDHSIVRLAPSTVLALRSAGGASPSGTGSTDVTLSQGELWARVFKPITDDSYFNVSTEESSVGVRGTSVYVKRDGATKETTTFAMDSGLPIEPVTPGSSAIKLYPKGAISPTDLRLAQVVITKSIAPDLASITTNYASTGTTIYTSTGLLFVRIATLADLGDFDALKQGIGNLPTISMTSGWLKTNDIWSGSLASSATNKIIYNDPLNPKIALEITRTEARGLEGVKLCTDMIPPPNPSTGEQYKLWLFHEDRTEEVRCNTNLIASINRFGYTDPTTEATKTKYFIDGASYLSGTTGGFIPKNGDESITIGGKGLKDAAGKDISSTGSSWTGSMLVDIVSYTNPQHLINIGSGTQYLRVFLDSSNQIHIAKTEGANITDKSSGISLGTNTINLVKTTNKYKLYVGGSFIGEVEFNTPIQTIFVGKNYVGSQPWGGAINNIQITK